MAHAQERLEELERHRAVLDGSLARLRVLTDGVLRGDRRAAARAQPLS